MSRKNFLHLRRRIKNKGFQALLCSWSSIREGNFHPGKKTPDGDLGLQMELDVPPSSPW